MEGVAKGKNTFSLSLRERERVLDFHLYGFPKQCNVWSSAEVEQYRIALEVCRTSEAGLCVRHYLITGIDKSRETAADAFFTRLSFDGSVQRLELKHCISQHLLFDYFYQAQKLTQVKNYKETDKKCISYINSMQWKRVLDVWWQASDVTAVVASASLESSGGSASTTTCPTTVNTGSRIKD